MTYRKFNYNGNQIKCTVYDESTVAECTKRWNKRY